MHKFNFPQFFLDFKTSTAEISRRLHMHYRSVQKMTERGTVKLPFVKLLETEFGDCSKYLTVNLKKNKMNYGHKRAS